MNLVKKLLQYNFVQHLGGQIIRNEQQRKKLSRA